MGRTSTPGRSLSTRKVVKRGRGPLGVSFSPVTATRRMKSAWSAWEMNCFVPLITQSEPSRTPRVWIEGAADPPRALAPDRRQEVALDLLPLAGEEDRGGSRVARAHRPARARELAV